MIKFKHSSQAWFVIIILILANQPVFSQMRDTVNLSEVVVTGEAKPVLADKSLYQIKSITNREIRGRGATNLSELLSSELSFKINQDAALGSSLKLNGLSGEHVKILIDGIPLVGRQAGILDLSQINLFKVDHIEVVEGPMSVIYGSNALGGVINIISQKPVYGNTSRYKVRTYYESVGVYNADIDALVSRNKHTFNLSAGRHFFGGYSTPNDTLRSQTWKPKLQWNGNLDYSFRTEKIKLNIGSSVFTEELRNKGNPVYDPEKALDEYHYTTRSLNKIDFSAPLFKKFNTNILASYSYYNKRKLTTVKNLVTLDEFPYDDPSAQDTTTFGDLLSRWMVNGPISKKLNVQSGIEFNRENGAGKRIGGDKSITESAGFASFKYTILSNLNTQAGLRYIYNSKFKAPLIYSFNSMWDINPDVKLRFSLGKGFRAPSLKELYFEFIDINHHVLGNDSLKAEESFYLGLTSDYDFNNKFSLHFGTFRNSIKNRIDLLYSSIDATKAQYYNLNGKQSINQGFKLTANFEQSDFRVQFGTQLTALSKINTTNQFNWSTDASLNSTYTISKLKSKISLYYKFNGKYVFYTAEYNEIGQLAAIHENFLSKYQSLDIVFTKWLFQENLEIAVGGKNLFNNKDIIGRGSSGPHGGGDGINDNPVGWGRTFFIQLQFNLRHDGK